MRHLRSGIGWLSPEMRATFPDRHGQKPVTFVEPAAATARSVSADGDDSFHFSRVVEPASASATKRSRALPGRAVASKDGAATLVNITLLTQQQRPSRHVSLSKLIG